MNKSSILAALETQSHTLLSGRIGLRTLAFWNVFWFLCFGDVMAGVFLFLGLSLLTPRCGEANKDRHGLMGCSGGTITWD